MLGVLKNKIAEEQTSGFNEQWDVIEVTENDLIGTVGCLIMGIMDLLKGQTKGKRRSWRPFSPMNPPLMPSMSPCPISRR